MHVFFYREASEPAAARFTNAASFETHARLARSLKSLTRAQRSDAVHTDWLLKLLRPANLGRDLIRSLLIGQGAAGTH